MLVTVALVVLASVVLRTLAIVLNSAAMPLMIPPMPVRVVTTSKPILPQACLSPARQAFQLAFMLFQAFLRPSLENDLSRVSQLSATPLRLHFAPWLTTVE